MKEQFIDKRFSESSLATIRQANEIIEEYKAEGYILTLRQLFYQFVSRDLISNKTTEYKRLGSVVNDGRLSGLIDWDAIEDRTRNLQKLAHFASAKDIARQALNQFRIDKWFNQPTRVEVWIEKEALAGVFERVCNELDVPFLCCRGYLSQSEMYSAAQRIKYHKQAGQEFTILHFGDHDPSGIDMSRDMRERLTTFECFSLTFERLALNIEQVLEYEPPPNPAKETDSRFESYIRKFGEKSWELDALEPAVLSALVEKAVEGIRDPEKWADALALEQKHRRDLKNLVDKLK